MKPTSNNSWASLNQKKKIFYLDLFQDFRPQALIMPMMIQVFKTKTRDKKVWRDRKGDNFLVW
jgi:hypothetical protein